MFSQGSDDAWGHEIGAPNAAITTPTARTMRSRGLNGIRQMLTCWSSRDRDRVSQTAFVISAAAGFSRVVRFAETKSAHRMVQARRQSDVRRRLECGFAKSIGVYLNGDAIPGVDSRGESVKDDSFYMLFNAHHEAMDFILPEGPWASASRACSIPRGTRVAVRAR